MSEKNKGMVLAALIVVAALVWYFGGKGSAVQGDAAAAASAAYKPLAVENPELRHSILDRSRKTEYKSTGRDLFSMVAPPPPQEIAKVAAKRPTNIGPVPEPPPPPPTLPANVKFFGYGTVPNGSVKLAFLTDGDQVFVVGEGETLLGKYRVVKIGNANLDFEEIATGRRGSATLSEEPAAPAS
jgi:hypothetical protein